MADLGTESSIGRRRRGGVSRAVVAALLLAAGAGAGWTGARRAADGEPAAESRVVTAPVARRDLGATVLATGVVRPQVGAQVAVGSRVSGVLRRLHVTVGERVAAGQLLAELDRVELETQVARAEAALANAHAERAYAERELERTEQLAASNAAADVERTAARRQYETARARADEAAAALQAARVQLEYATIRAPIAGVVGSISTQEGETVAASLAAPTFLTVVDLSRLEVWAYVDETDIGRVAAGQTARFTVDAYPDTAFTGRVTAIRPSAEIVDNVVNYVTLIAIEDAAGRVLRPEMTTTVNIALEGRTDVPSVPNGALRRDADGTYVLVATAAGAERRDVRVGFRGAEHAEVLSGVTEGERVVLGAAQPCTPVAAGGERR